MTNIFAQVGISTTSITPDATSILELRSTTLGFLAPRMTTTQRDAITSPATGLLIYNITTNQLNYYSGSAWQVVTGGGQSQLNGTGFVKASGTTISYDNSTYITSAVTSFSKTDNYGITSSVTNPTTTPTHTIGVDTTLISSRLWRQKGIDSLSAIIATKGTGTVTSFSKTDNYGITSSVTNSTTTPTHTIGVDTTLISSRLWRQKGIDSLGAIIATKGTGTVTSASIISANGFAGTVATATTTPAITLSTSITGLIKGNGTAISAATSGTDYSAGTSALATGILKSTTTTGDLSIAVASDFPTLNQNTTGTAAGSLIAVRTITSGTTYTPTSGTTKILIQMVGGGGGGGGAITQYSAGAGGGSGGFLQKYITGISSATTYTIAIGTGGNGGIATGGATGNSGTATTFTTDASATPASTTFIANGGIGGVGSNSGSTKTAKAGGAGGTCTNGDINNSGTPGSFSISRGNAEYEITGSGGSSNFGGGGAANISTGGNTDIAGKAATGFGAGGGGAYAGTGTGAAGGAGSAGVIIIYEYK